MTSQTGCRCGGGGGNGADFDAREAFLQLSQRVNDLADTLTSYMSDAGLERDERTRGARRLATAMMRIVGGTRVQEGDFPACCVVGQAVGSSVEWFCTGTLIHPRAVITAAHCAPDRPNRVLLRASNTSFTADAEMLEVMRMRVHPDYVPGGSHDLCMLILKTASTVDPVSIASTAELTGANTDTVHLVGFGYNDPNQPIGFGVKREVDVAIGSLRRKASDNLSNAEERYGFDGDVEFVAGRKGLGKDTCNGDSGGPAFIRVGDSWRLAGVTSRATSEAGVNCGDGGIYGRPDVLQSWINEVLGEFGLRRAPARRPRAEAGGRRERAVAGAAPSMYEAGFRGGGGAAPVAAAIAQRSMTRALSAAPSLGLVIPAPGADGEGGDRKRNRSTGRDSSGRGGSRRRKGG